MVDERKKISPYITWFIIHPVQFGMAELWFGRLLMEDAGYDGWMGVVIGGFCAHIMIWLIYSVLNDANKSAVDVNREVFGNWLGGTFSFALIVLFILEGIAVLRSYTQVIQVWLFPTMGTWLVGLIVLFLVFYTVIGGFRVVVGVCFLGFLIPIVLLTPVLAVPLAYAHFGNLFPVFHHPVGDLLKAGKDMTMAFLGFEGLLIAYPFIQRPRISQKWAHFSNLFTIFFYLLITVIMFAYFSENQLKELLWPKLTLVTLTRLPFLKGFEFIFISLWMLVILPNMAFAVWAASRAAKELFHVKQQMTLWGILVCILIASLLIPDYKKVMQFNQFASLYGLYFLCFYLVVLWAVQRVQGKLGRKKCKKTSLHPAKSVSRKKG
jgi:spore germination protein (amino acid permease)